MLHVRKVKVDINFMKKGKKEVKYFFGKSGTCVLYLRLTRTNVFLTFTDLKKHVVRCVTSGSAGFIGNKRQKKNAYVLGPILLKLYPFFKFYNIKSVILVLKSNFVYSYLFYLFKELSFRGIKIIRLIDRITKPHNGMKKKKKKRK